MSDDLILLALIGGTLLYGFFVLGYVATKPWWETWEGRALVASSSGTTLLLGGLWFGHGTHDVPDGAWLAVASVVLIGGVFKVALLLRAWWLDLHPRP
jgi:hypothetical protein